MHPPERVREVLALADTGLNNCEISRQTGVPRATVRDWVRGSTPRRSRGSDRGCPTCGGLEHQYTDLPIDYAYLLGLYLGDGCISTHPRAVYRLRISLDLRYPEIIAECARAVAALVPDNKVSVQTIQDSWVSVHAYSKAWPCLFPQHGPGKKHLRKIVLTEWQQRHAQHAPELLLRGLIQSDGCRFTNTGRGSWRSPRYAFYNKSPEIRAIFCEACERIGVHWTLSRPETIYVSRMRDVAFLDRFIGPKR